LTSTSDATTTSESAASSGGGAKRQIEDEINDSWNEIRRSDEIAHETLRQVEPVDKALCRARPGCEWSRDCDPIFKFFRQEWGLRESFPANGDAERLLSKVKEPSTRVAAAMGAVTTEKLWK
jgi:hypothetical protein